MSRGTYVVILKGGPHGPVLSDKTQHDLTLAIERVRELRAKGEHVAAIVFASGEAGVNDKGTVGDPGERVLRKFAGERFALPSIIKRERIDSGIADEMRWAYEEALKDAGGTHREPRIEVIAEPFQGFFLRVLNWVKVRIPFFWVVSEDGATQLRVSGGMCR